MKKTCLMPPNQRAKPISKGGQHLTVKIGQYTIGMMALGTTKGALGIGLAETKVDATCPQWRTCVGRYLGRGSPSWICVIVSNGGILTLGITFTNVTKIFHMSMGRKLCRHQVQIHVLESLYSCKGLREQLFSLLVSPSSSLVSFCTLKLSMTMENKIYFVRGRCNH